MTIGIITLYLATIIGLFSIKKIRPVIFAVLPLLLLVTSLNETWITVLQHRKQAMLFYNIFSLLELTAWCFVFYHTNKVFNKWLHVSAWFLLLLFSIIEIATQKGFHSTTYRVFSVYVIINCLIYFFSLVNTRKEHSIWKDGVFWLFTGALIFHVVFFFYLTALEYPEFRNAKEAMQAFRLIFDIINIVYYVMLARGFICLAYYRL